MAGAADAASVGSARSLLMAGLWLGLAYGLAEAAESCLLGLVPGALSWRNGNSPRILAVAPAFYGCVGVALGAVFAALSVAIRRVDWMKVLVFVALAGGAALGAMLQGQVFRPWASVLLGLGIGVQLTRWYVRRRERLHALMRRTLLPLVSLVVVAALAQWATTEALERRALAALPPTSAVPNVLVLVADTLRADHLSSYGYRRPTTPNLDRLAAEGTLFLDAYSASSWTLPAHASLFTGRRMHEHRAGMPSHPYLDARFPTLAEVLRARGYATGGFVGNTFWCGRSTGLDRGFVHYEDYYATLGDALTRTVLGRLLAYEALPHAGFVDIPGRKRAADVNDRLLRWIDGLQGRPFFAFANYMDLHGPYIPPPAYDGRYAGTKLDLRTVDLIEIGMLDETRKVPEPAVLRSSIDRYDEALSYLDAEVGRLIDELARRGLLDRTILVFTSDHGEAFGEHDLVYHGHSLYQDQIRIPLMVRFPAQVPAGVRDPKTVDLDQVPSLVASLAGLGARPFGARSPMDSAAARAGAPIAVSEVGRRRGVPPAWPTASGGLRSLQTAQWKLIVNDSGALELYDLASDPLEQKNLSGDARFAQTLARLQARLAAETKPSALAASGR